ncbi:MAG: ferric reductase-like transmembrane domain-containing protein [Pseudomonadota bacterium]
MSKARKIAIWAGLALAVAVPLVLAGFSPQLAWRDPIYIGAGFAGIVAMALLLIQPLLAGGLLPGIRAGQSRRLHRYVGAGLITAVILHVLGLWITSAPDVIDALTFTSPTPFSDWGVIAMWALFAAGLLALLRRRLSLRPQVWRLAHTGLAAVVVVGSVVHAWLIQGTMETISKAVLCALVILVTVKVLADLRVWVINRRRRA